MGLGEDIAGAFGFTQNTQPSNYYQQAAQKLYDPARAKAISGIAAEKGEAEQVSNQRNQIQGITGPMAVENQQRNERLIGEAGGRTLNDIDEQGRQSMYKAAEADRQENIAMQKARQEAIFNGFKMGAGLLTGAWTGLGLGEKIGGIFNQSEQAPTQKWGEAYPDINIPDYKAVEQPTYQSPYSQLGGYNNLSLI